jgi:glycosyltransferase involved in cell wall biosynthesis
MTKAGDLSNRLSDLSRSSTGGAREASQDDQKPPLVSIIVVAYRDREEVGALIDNIAPMRGANLEFVIIDGGFEDGTRELLQARSADVDYWISEPDNGIYDAMNKGISAARGEYVLHINAGDRLLQLPMAKLAELAGRQIDVVCCRVLEDGNHLFTPRNSWLIRIDNPWHHQGTLYRRAAHLGYDSSYRVFGDFDHNQRLRKANKSVEILDAVIAIHRTDGASRLKDHRMEVFRSIRANFGSLYLLPAFVRFQLIRLRAALRFRPAA